MAHQYLTSTSDMRSHFARTRDRLISTPLRATHYEFAALVIFAASLAFTAGITMGAF